MHGRRLAGADRMSGPFAASTVDAVAACTRALADAHDADAPLESADAATLGGLRAFGDRLALRRRFHDPAVHDRWRPADPRPAALFEALEAARLDALGARWLSGVAKNLVSYPGADPDGVRWLAFEVFSERAAPGEAHTQTIAVRAALPSALLAALTALAENLTDQAGFSGAAAAWAVRAAPHLPPPVPRAPDA